MIFLNPFTELVPLPLQCLIYAAFGLSVGSFLNVLIFRLPPLFFYKGDGPPPDGLCVPSSKCPNCRSTLRWYHNIPVLSFLLLKAKCAFCGVHISWRYPVIELLNAFLWVSIWIIYLEPSLNIATFGVALLSSALLAIAMIFWDWRKNQSKFSSVN